ncbi:MAG: Response regulator receiver domain [Fibrobacteres bacterium]|nr:Response regulator receiver domain [Fibrobacterota bacterium]
MRYPLSNDFAIDKSLGASHEPMVVSDLANDNPGSYRGGGAMEKSRHILLLEDEPILRGMLALTLSRRGYRVLTAGTLLEGEALVRTMGWSWADLVLSDANLGREPDRFDGYLFHARWRARFPVPPFLFMVGGASAGGILVPGQDDCRVGRIEKPFRPGDLVSLIGAMLA